MATSLQNLQGNQNKSPVATLNNYFTKYKDQLAAALPKHVTPDRMARLALTSFSQNKALTKCTPESIFGSVIVASQLGLEIGVDGQGYLVPYKGTCTFIPGWKGYVDLVSRSGRATVWTGAVFEGDEFDYQLGSEPYVRHRPGAENDPNLLSHVYAIGKVNGSEIPVIEVWSMEKIWKHRDINNKVGRNHYSYKHPEMYARKIPLLQVIKYMPKSVELSNAMQIDLAATEGKTSTYMNGDFQIIDVDQPSDEEPTPETANAEGKPQQESTSQADEEPTPETANAEGKPQQESTSQADIESLV